MSHKRFLFILACNLLPFCAAAQTTPLVHFPMEVDGREITETVSNRTFAIEGNGTPVPSVIEGVLGNALRLDGYSNYIKASGLSQTGDVYSQLSFSLWCAVETYPVMTLDAETNERTLIAGNLDDNAKTGFGFLLGRDGRYSFECYSEGWKVICEVPEKLPCYAWNHLVATLDGTTRMVSLYNNGNLLVSSRSMKNFALGTADFHIGKSAKENRMGLFNLNTFNGIIDEVTVSEGLLSEEEISKTANGGVCLNFPASRYENDLMRPRFHGIPSGNWTNECHGLAKVGDTYHLFFQKNGNGPYMTRLQWGHLESKDLLDWNEVPVALNTDQTYDIKGCWSGTVFTDELLTGGKPHIFYTAVDYAKAVMAEAVPNDDNLLSWTKPATNPIIDGRPSGLSDDFRDPYVFRADDGNYYMIVGTSKNNLGAVTLHKYNVETRRWSNTGQTFFVASDSSSGRFWEMPTIGKIGDKWLFTATPLETTQGVEVQYWTGTLNADGTFSADKQQPNKLELDGMGRDGFGMLSPSILQTEGKTIALGIVPDKLPAERNYALGYAHTYSLPREWSLDDAHQLVQRPYAGLQNLRTATSYMESNTTLSGDRTMGNVAGRMVEVIGEWTVDRAVDKVGFHLLDNGTKAMLLYYSPKENTITVDMRQLDRWSNDAGVFDGLYTSALPQSLANGSILKIHAFLDHSILDVFVNDTWAFSLRVFATDVSATGVKAFAEGEAVVKTLAAYTLSKNGDNDTAIQETEADSVFRFDGKNIHTNADGVVTIYGINGILLASYTNTPNIPLYGRYKGVLVVRYQQGGDTHTAKITL